MSPLVDHHQLNFRFLFNYKQVHPPFYIHLFVTLYILDNNTWESIDMITLWYLILLGLLFNLSKTQLFLTKFKYTNVSYCTNHFNKISPSYWRPFRYNIENHHKCNEHLVHNATTFQTIVGSTTTTIKYSVGCGKGQ